MIKLTTHEGALFFIAIAHIRSLSQSRVWKNQPIKNDNGGTVIVFSNGDVAEVKEAIDRILALIVAAQ